jgi:uncharacterized protein (TIGR02145 family)
MQKKIILTLFLSSQLLFLFGQDGSKSGSFTDNRDGKIYKTIKIGNQTWMAQNLAYKTDSACRAFNNDSKYISVYGYLYSWEAANIACPQGWHLPNDQEWTILIDYLGGKEVAGGKLKSTEFWMNPNTGASNIAKFSALPGGCSTYDDGEFISLGKNGYWWSSSPLLEIYAWSRYLYFDGSNIERNCSRVSFGFSVRCIKD